SRNGATHEGLNGLMPRATGALSVLAGEGKSSRSLAVEQLDLRSAIRVPEPSQGAVREYYRSLPRYVVPNTYHVARHQGRRRSLHSRLELPHSEDDRRYEA